MAHSIHVGFLSVNDYAARMIDAILEKDIISQKNLFISDTNPEHITEYNKHGVNVLKDDASVLMKSEIVVIAAPKREFGTVLAPINALTRGKIIVSMTEGIDCNYVLERVAHGTLVATAMPTVGDNGCRIANIQYSVGFPEYMKAACRDIVGSVCK